MKLIAVVIEVNRVNTFSILYGLETQAWVRLLKESGIEMMLGVGLAGVQVPEVMDLVYTTMEELGVDLSEWKNLIADAKVRSEYDLSDYLKDESLLAILAERDKKNQPKERDPTE